MTRALRPRCSRRHDAVRLVALAAMFDNEEVEAGRYSARLLLHDPNSSSRPRDAIPDCQVRAGCACRRAACGAGERAASPLRYQAARARAGSTGPGLLALCAPPDLCHRRPPHPPHQVEAFTNEADLFRRLLQLVGALDPDLLLGWDLQRGSLGYLVDRGSALGVNLARGLSRWVGAGAGAGGAWASVVLGLGLGLGLLG